MPPESLPDYGQVEFQPDSIITLLFLLAYKETDAVGGSFVTSCGKCCREIEHSV